MNNYCPICKTEMVEFCEMNNRKKAACLICFSLERHRLAWLFFERKTNLFNGKKKKMLHFAPEPIFEEMLGTEHGIDYMTADLKNPTAMFKMDISNIKFKNNYCDVFFCSHVLEHVPDDMKAIKEIYRVLKPKGWAVIIVPFGKAVACGMMSTPEERHKTFGVECHYRIYGKGFKNKLEDVGFDVSIIRPSDFLDRRTISRCNTKGTIFYCKKNKGMLL